MPSVPTSHTSYKRLWGAVAWQVFADLRAPIHTGKDRRVCSRACEAGAQLRWVLEEQLGMDEGRVEAVMVRFERDRAAAIERLKGHAVQMELLDEEYER